MELAQRRTIGRFAQIALIVLAVLLAARWVGFKVGSRKSHVTVQRAPVAEEALGPGDLRIYNRDSTVDVVLQGNRILAGLSPKTIAKVQAEMEREAGKETSGLGGMIASTVKRTVASSIGIHVVYPLSDIRDLRYEDGQILVTRRDGKASALFGNTKVNGERQRNSFRQEDAERFIAAVRARQSALP